MVIDYVTGEQLLDMEARTCCKSYYDSVDRDELIKFSDMIWMRQGQKLHRTGLLLAEGLAPHWAD